MEPVLRTSNVARGRICAVCFDNIPERKRARRNFHEIKDNSDFFKRAELWTVYEHEYAHLFLVSMICHRIKNFSIITSARISLMRDIV